jgi:serine/threonine-protein kinase RsbW
MSSADADNDNPVKLEFHAKAEYLSKVRRIVERLSPSASLNREEIDDLLTAVDEAVANAIRHGSPRGEHNRIRVVCGYAPGLMTVEVCDEGGGFSAPGAPVMPGPEAMGGRGLPLMCALADRVEIASTPTGACVTLKKASRHTAAAIM